MYETNCGSLSALNFEGYVENCFNRTTVKIQGCDQKRKGFLHHKTSYDVSSSRHLAALSSHMSANIPAPFEGVQLKYLLITGHLVPSSANSKNAFVIKLCQMIWLGV